MKTTRKQEVTYTVTMSAEEIVITSDVDKWNEEQIRDGVRDYDTICLHGGSSRGVDYFVNSFMHSCWSFECNHELHNATKVRDKNMIAVAATLKMYGHSVIVYVFPTKKTSETNHIIKLAQQHELELKVYPLGEECLST